MSTGRTYPPVRIDVDAQTIEAFRAAIGATAAGVPPTFAAVYALGATAPQLFGDEEAKVDVAMLVHGSQEFEFSRSPQPGETLEAVAEIVSDQVRRGMRFITLETRVTGTGGHPVCVSRMLSVIRGSA